MDIKRWWITITINIFHSSAWVKVCAGCMTNFAMQMFSCLKDTYNITNKIIGIGYAWKCKEASEFLIFMTGWEKKTTLNV